MTNSSQDKKAQSRQVNVRIEEELLDWFEEFYPQFGAKTWFFNEALRKFKELHDVKSEDMIEKSLRELLD